MVSLLVRHPLHAMIGGSDTLPHAISRETMDMYHINTLNQRCPVESLRVRGKCLGDFGIVPRANCANALRVHTLVTRELVRTRERFSTTRFFAYIRANSSMRTQLCCVAQIKMTI
jgi:hypothetical protein